MRIILTIVTALSWLTSMAGDGCSQLDIGINEAKTDSLIGLDDFYKEFANWTGESRICKILPETNCISYFYHSNSGTMLDTTIKIYSDSLIWDYESKRWGCYHIRDKREIKKEDFTELIDSFNGMEFEVTEKQIIEEGGSRTRIGFYIDDKYYCHFSSDDIFSNGGFYNIEAPILKFIDNHKTECQLLYEEIGKKLYGEYHCLDLLPLPQELEKYRVKKEQ